MFTVRVHVYNMGPDYTPHSRDNCLSELSPDSNRVRVSSIEVTVFSTVLLNVR